MFFNKLFSFANPEFVEELFEIFAAVLADGLVEVLFIGAQFGDDGLL